MTKIVYISVLMCILCGTVYASYRQDVDVWDLRKGKLFVYDSPINSGIVDVNEGAVLFGDPNGNITWDVTNFYFDDTNDALTLGGYMDLGEITAPITPPVNTLRLYVEDIHGFSFFKYFDSTGMKREIVRDSMIIVYNDSGSTITTNRVVYATGNLGSVPTIAKARANSASTMPAIGVTIESIANLAYGRVMQVGLLENLNTSTLSVGDVLYVHDTVAGLVRITPPITPALTQEIGTVLVDDASVGAIQVVARSIAGDEYGTAQNDFYIGDGAAGTKNLHFNAVSDATLAWDETELTLTGGPLDVTSSSIQIKRETSDISNPPTNAEITSAFGTPAAAGEGFIALMDDNDAATNIYIVASTGTTEDRWWYAALTQSSAIAAENVIYAAENVVYAAEQVVYP